MTDSPLAPAQGFARARLLVQPAPRVAPRCIEQEAERGKMRGKGSQVALRILSGQHGLPVEKEGGEPVGAKRPSRAACAAADQHEDPSRSNSSRMAERAPVAYRLEEASGGGQTGVAACFEEADSELETRPQSNQCVARRVPSRVSPQARR